MPRPFRTALLALAFVGAVGAAAHAQAGNAYQTTWAALDPGDDWAAQVLRSIFPIGSGTALPGIGAENTVIGKMVGQFSGFIIALAAAFMAYTTVVQIHRAAESGNVLSNSTSSWAPVRLAFALSMMFPLPSGFSTGQAAVMQSAMWGIGMARSVYTSAIKAVGPDAVPIAQPMIPGTKSIVMGLIENELCAALVNAASANPNLVPSPTPVTGAIPGNPAWGGAYVAWPYVMSNGNSTGAPVCGSVTIRQPNPNATNYAGVSVDMTAAQQQALTSVIQNDIRPDAQSVAQQLWQTRQASALTQLMSTMVKATADYTQQLTQTATNFTSALRNGLSNADAARGGQLGLAANQNQLSALGWTEAGAYYVEIARLNGQTLSLLSAVPIVQPPNYDGLGTSLSSDLAPLTKAILTFQQKMKTYVDTTDGTDAPGGNAELYSGATPGEVGASVLEEWVRKLHINERILNAMVTAMSPTTGTGWTDPFAALINLGQTLVLTSISAFGMAVVLSSTTATAGTVALNVLTFNFTGAAAAAAGHTAMTFLATPIFYCLMGLLIPGLLIAYVLPMVPFAMWIAGVAGWLILVIEAMIAVPLWMFAHLTLQGDGLHGRGIDGYGLIINVMFRPVLMLFGLFAGYFVFSAMCSLMLQGFGIASGFVLSNGWLVTNLLGIIVLLCMFVLMTMTLALVSFRMISLVPHHVIKMLPFVQPANRLDIERFSQDVGAVGMAGTLNSVKSGRDAMLQAAQASERIGSTGGDGGQGARGPIRLLGHDTTLNAQTDVIGPASEEG
jgi:conjugal transfer/type IV secretion protein DotA/TraY